MTCILNDIPDGYKAVKNKWVLMAKESQNGSTSQYNAWFSPEGLPWQMVWTVITFLPRKVSGKEFILKTATSSSCRDKP
jgi:hypothetical protein